MHDDEEVEGVETIENNDSAEDGTTIDNSNNE